MKKKSRFVDEIVTICIVCKWPRRYVRGSGDTTYLIRSEKNIGLVFLFDFSNNITCAVNQKRSEF